MDLLILGTFVYQPERIEREIDHQTVWKVYVWCGIIGSQIVGPVFFDKNLNGNRYSTLIVTDLPVLLENLSL